MESFVWLACDSGGLGYSAISGVVGSAGLVASLHSEVSQLDGETEGVVTGRWAGVSAKPPREMFSSASSLGVSVVDGALP